MKYVKHPFRVLSGYPRRVAAVLLAAGIILLAPATVLAGKKTDLIYLKNGDRITGEVKELSQGLMRLKTDALDTVYIKWEDINHIKSDKWLQVELTDGTRFFGQSPEPSEESHQLVLQTQRGPVTLDFDDIVRLEQIKVDEKLWKRLDTKIKLGYNFTKASDVATTNINASTTYRTREFLTSLSLDATRTRKGEGDDTKRADLTFAYLRFKKNRWFWFGSASAQTNEELGIAGRLLGSGGLGRYLRQSSKTDWFLSAGLAANLEKTVSDELDNRQNEASWEGLIQTEWNFYRLYTPKSNWRVRMQLYPGITDTDRNRGNLDVTFQQEFFKDLFWDLSFYYTYDSKPPETASAKDDYGIVTSVGYTF